MTSVGGLGGGGDGRRCVDKQRHPGSRASLLSPSTPGWVRPLWPPPAVPSPAAAAVDQLVGGWSTSAAAGLGGTGGARQKLAGQPPHG